MDVLLDGSDWQLIHLMPTEWMWRQVWKEDWDPQRSPAAGQWLPGTVPGDVIADALDARLIPDPYVDTQSRAGEWLSERDWLYRKQFTMPLGSQGKHLRLHFDGVDYVCHVFLNGQRLGRHEGMFAPFEYDVTALLRFDRPNTLSVVVEHAPGVDAVQGQIGWSSRARIWKSRFAYNWDWCTRLVPIGIWQSVKLIATDTTWLTDLSVRSMVYESAAKAEIATELAAANDVEAGASEAAEVRLTVLNPVGDPVGETHDAVVQVTNYKGNYVFRLDINDPQLWWPNGMGDQPLYTARVEVLGPGGMVTDSRQVQFGLRNLRAVPNDNAAPDALPYTLEVNGRRLFVKGWNWAPVDNLYGRPQTKRYERLLTLAKHAHCNLLRVWGGGVLEREAFYDMCDRLGILVWQEFHQSSSGIDNRPPEDEAYLAEIEQQARQIVPLRRNHPCLAIWCGGNELMDDSGIPLTDSHPALARLKAIVDELDPGRMWLPTSSTGPVFSADPKLAGSGKMHDVHGPWQYQGPEEQYRFFNDIDPLYHSEFGAEGAANLFTLQRFVSPPYQWPPDATNPVWVHHGSWWLHREKLEAMFGTLEDIGTFVRASQWMQAEGLRYAIESNRRRKWHCSGTSPWQLNEAFPNTACTNAVDYLGLTKPAYWWVRRAYEPIHISARYDRITWHPGDVLSTEIWVNNSAAAVNGWRWTASLIALDGSVLAQVGGDTDLPDNGSARVGELRHTLPQAPGVCLLVVALQDSAGITHSRNEYVFSTAQPSLQPMLRAPQTDLDVMYRHDELQMRNTGSVPALFVQIEPADGQWLLPDDDYCCLLPGESRSLRLVGQGNAIVTAWNTKPHPIRLT